MILHPGRVAGGCRATRSGLEIRNQILRLRCANGRIVEVDYSGVPIEVQGRKWPWRSCAMSPKTADRARAARSERQSGSTRCRPVPATWNPPIASCSKPCRHCSWRRTNWCAPSGWPRWAHYGGRRGARAEHTDRQQRDGSQHAAGKTREFSQEFTGGTLKKSGLTSYIETAAPRPIC